MAFGKNVLTFSITVQDILLTIILQDIAYIGLSYKMGLGDEIMFTKP